METITNDTPVKIKNPKNVAKGKRLALVSKEAKAKKKLEREMVEERRMMDTDEGGSGWYLLGLLTCVGAGGLMYFELRPGEVQELKIVASEVEVDRQKTKPTTPSTPQSQKKPKYESTVEFF